MNILHLHTELNLACGITRTIFQIISNSQGIFNHNLISLGGNAFSRFEKFKPKLKVLNIDRFSISGSLKIIFVLFKYCKQNSIQVVHSHHRYFDTIIWIVKPFLKIKTITSVQSKVQGEKIFSYKADKLIACSETIKKNLLNNFDIDANRIKVIYNAAEPCSVLVANEIAQLKNDIGIKSDKFIIGFIGRIDFAEKGVDVLLDAFNELSISNPNIHLLLIGDGPNNQEVKSFCEIHKTTTTFLSSKENIFDYYNVMDLVTLPSKVDPFPLTMLEAGYMSRPFLGSNVDGIPELISNEENGLLFESGNVEELKEKIIRIYTDRKFGEKLAQNLHKKVLDCFTVDKIIPQYEKLYTELLVE